MTRKVIHEHKIPKSVTVALYAIAIALTLNLAKPFVKVSTAQASEASFMLINMQLENIYEKIDMVDSNVSNVWNSVINNGLKLNQIHRAL